MDHRIQHPVPRAVPVPHRPQAHAAAQPDQPRHPPLRGASARRERRQTQMGEQAGDGDATATAAVMRSVAGTVALDLHVPAAALQESVCRASAEARCSFMNSK